MDDLSNRVIKNYEFKECVGAGGFGQVYRAYQPSVGREVAVKVILPQHANQPDFIRRFEVEAQIIARLEHPHVVPLYDYWRDPEGAFLVMRWLKGSLREGIQRGPWSVEAASRLLDEIAGALAVAHREGVIHRDIKPDNILLDEDENAYLADFGIAKDLNVGGSTEEGAIVGSLAYITPEQITGGPITPRSDIYSLGLVMYEILVSERPFKSATTPVEWINVHLNTPLPHLNLQRPNLPAALNEVLQTATAKDPAHRYPNVTRFAAAFRAATPVPQRGPAQPLATPLTERELDILKLMVEGLSTQEVARKLFLTVGTVKWYINQIYNKLDVHSRYQAIQRALQLNLIAELDQPPSPSAITMNVVSKPEQSQIRVIKESRTDFINPYKGLRSFQEADAHDFFGRATLTEQLLTRLSDQGNDAQFLAVVGPSGSGKSSVVKAGLIPALRRDALPNSARWFITEMLSGTHALEELEAALLRVAVTPLPGLLDQLTEDRRGLVRAAKRVLPADQNVELILVIDQFEELFTLLPDESVRTHFIDNILSAVTDPRSRIRVILTLRADFYDKPLLYPRLAELVRSHTEVVVPLTSQELERAIVGPAERIGLQFEPGLVATIINDIGEQPGTLPLLQYALTELFERREGVTLTLDAYKNSSGISGSLARRADELYGDLEAEGQAAARQLFLRLITLGEGTEDTRRRVLQSELALMGSERILDEVINTFVQYRLLTLDRDPVTRGPTVEIAHEALIREWTRLREWLAESRDVLRVQRRVMAATTEWENSKYERSFLAAGTRLAQFAMLVSDSDLALNASEKAYIEASVKERDQRALEEQKRQAREKTLEQRSRMVLRGLVVVLLLAVIGALGLTSVAVKQSQVADDNASYARSMALAAAAKSAQLSNNPDQAIALAVAANTTTTQPPALAESVLYETAFAPATRKIYSGKPGFGETLSPDGHKVLSWSMDNTLAYWDLDTQQTFWTKTPDSLGGEVVGAAIFAPNGETAYIELYPADGSNSGSVNQYDLKTGKQSRQFILPDEALQAVVWGQR